MSLGQRIKTVLQERNVSQVSFAKTLGISENYVSLIANDKKERISDTLAKLIEESYGYSSTWILTGDGEKIIKPNLSERKKDVIKKIQYMSDDEIKAVSTFLKYLENE